MFYGNYATQIEFITERWIGTSVSVLLTHISGAFIFKHVQVRNPQKSMFNTFGVFFLVSTPLILLFMRLQYKRKNKTNFSWRKTL